MNRSVVVSVAPAAEPVSLTAMKLHLRELADDQDPLISSLIQAAREKVEIETRRALVTQTQILRLDGFPRSGDADRPLAISVPNPPLQSVTSIQYVDQNGDPQTLDPADYLVDTSSEPARITPVYNGSWPIARAQMNAVTVTYVCGYTPGEGSPTDYAENVPEGLKAAIKLLVASWYENREAVGPLALKPVPMAYDSLIWNHRILTL